MSAMRTWSAVGRVVDPRGATRRRPLSAPAIIFIEQGMGTRASPRPCPVGTTREIVWSRGSESRSQVSSYRCEGELTAPAGEEALAEGAVGGIAELGIE